MEHKAYTFQYELFVNELRPLLLAALERRDATELVEFVSANVAILSDSTEGEALDDHWTDAVDVRDVDQVGDLALTKYYDPKVDFGLGKSWTEIDDELVGLGLPAALVLGSSLTGGGTQFDPGKMGSYFQPPAQVVGALRTLEGCLPKLPPKLLPALTRYLEGVRKSEAAGLGLYVTF